MNAAFGIVIILAIAMLFHRCTTPRHDVSTQRGKDHFTYDLVPVVFDRQETATRWNGQHEYGVLWYVYKDDHGDEHWIPEYRGKACTIDKMQ